MVSIFPKSFYLGVKMSSMNIPIEIYQVLERKLGPDDAAVIAKSIEESLSHVEEQSKAISFQRKLEAKEELKLELRDELATKADIAELRGATKADIAELRGEMNVRFIATIAVILFVNKDAVMLIGHLLGLIK
jgi:hypothetical protein